MLALGSVPLGPPHTSVGASPSFAGRALLSVALLAGAILLLIGVTVGLLALNIALYQSGTVVFALLAAALAAVVAFGRTVMVVLRRPPVSPGEIEIPEATDGALWAEVRSLAAQVGTRPPDRVVAISDVNAYVHEQGRLLGLVPGQRTLAIGAPLLDVLTVTQLRAVLAHEMGHFAGGDTRLGPLTVRTQQVLSEVIGTLGRSLVSPLFVAYWRLQRRLSLGMRRAQELTADRAAVAVAGRQAAADALRAIEVAAEGHLRYLRGEVQPGLVIGQVPDDLAAGFRSFLAAPGTVDKLLAETGIERRAPDPWATHPPTHERIRRVEAIPEVSRVEPDGRAARALFAEPARWINAANAAWIARVAPNIEARAAVVRARATAPKSPSTPSNGSDDGLPKPLPAPPLPPFEATPEGWRARVPGRLGARTTVDLTDHSIAFGGQVIELDDVAHATISLGNPGDQGLNVTYTLEAADGRRIKVRTSSVTARGGDPLLLVANHVLTVLRVAVAPRLRAALVGQVAGGDRVEVGGLCLSPDGVARAGKQAGRCTPWGEVGNPAIVKRAIVLPRQDAVALVLPLAHRDSFLLLDLIPELRARLGADAVATS